MKFLAGLAVAATMVSSTIAHDAAPVYILRNQLPDLSNTSPELPREIVREIMLHRIGADSRTSFLDGLPENYDAEAAMDWIRKFGLKAATPVVEDPSNPDEEIERQLNMKHTLVILEGAQPEHVKQIEEKLPLAPSSKTAFYVADPPSHWANKQLYEKEIEPVTRDNDDVRVIFADLRKSDSIIDDLYNDGRFHQELIASGQEELMLVLLPESSRKSKLASWTSKKTSTKTNNINNELRRRDADSESVIAEEEVDTTTFGTTVNPVSSKENAAPSPHEWAALAPSAVPACFQSFNSCTTQTANCTGHGVCVDKYAVNSGKPASEDRRRDDGSAAPVCFVCHCYSTLNRPEDSPGGLSTTHWAGSMCQKKDVSVPFWLITSFTVLLVGAISFSIGLLFDVGEEKLPGVIGAGVSRSK